MQDYKKLDVWGKAHQLTLYIYKLTKAFPKEELYGITNQIRRAASSIPANIAEGCGRDSNAELFRFITIAKGSASEVEYFAFLAKELDYMNSNAYQTVTNEIIEIRKMLTSLQKKLK